jgi:hypothetical protein
MIGHLAINGLIHICNNYILEQIPTLSTFGLPNCKPENSNDGKPKAADLSLLVITILNMARVLELALVLFVFFYEKILNCQTSIYILKKPKAMSVEALV